MGAMFHPGASREQRRRAVKLERAAIRTGIWGDWETFPMPAGVGSEDGWLRRVARVSKNRLYVVLVRPVATEWGEVHHLAMRTASSLEPPWRDKQRIKDELFGGGFTAVEVMPPAGDVVDGADMYHIWVLPPGFELPFTLALARS